MPIYSESYVVNMAFRNILIAYGNKLNYSQFNKKIQWKDILERFNNKCCYCGQKIEKLEVDHIIGMNRTEMGFDCLGNVAPACPSCNGKKNNLSKKENKLQHGWKLHLEEICISDKKIYNKRKKYIEKYMNEFKYPPKTFKIGKCDYKKLQENLSNLEKKIRQALEETKSKL